MPYLIALVLLLASPVLGQVRVSAQLEKYQFLEGEPIFAALEVTNVGDEPLINYSCGGEFNLEIPGASRRVPPNIFGCSSAIGGLSHCGAEGSLLMPGESSSSRILLTEYSLKAGRYNLAISGKAGFRWNYNSMTQTGGSLPVSRHAETEPVPGDEVSVALSFNVVRGAEVELKRLLSKYVSEANRPPYDIDQLRRIEARKAIVESAQPFLEPLIAQIASEDKYLSGDAIKALGRIGNAKSRSDLKQLYAQSGNWDLRSFVVLTLARVGHADDAGFFADILETLALNGPAEPRAAREIKHYAALGLGHIGGDRAVRLLNHAIANVESEALPFIATALENTRSRSAIPVLIRLLAHSTARNEVCGALSTLTHRLWCDDIGDDVALQRRLRIWWDKNKSTVKIYGTDRCPDWNSLVPIQ